MIFDRYPKSRQQHGNALITVIVCSVIAAFIIAGMGELAVSHLSRATIDSEYNQALYIAEAGINYELSVIDLHPPQPDQLGPLFPNGVTHTFDGGSFTTYCTNNDGSTPWTPGTSLHIVSAGTYQGVTRTLNVAAHPYAYTPGNGTPFYTLFPVQAGVLNAVVGGLLPGSNVTVNGNIGSNGWLAYTGHPAINTSPYTTTFNGSGSGWLLGLNLAGFTSTTKSYAAIWPSVSQIASAMFPSNQYPPGGLSYLASNNDNSTANPPISSNSIVALGSSTITLYGKAGGSNYYLETLNLGVNSQIVFNNTNGPINIWVGPAGGISASAFVGGTATVKMATDSTKPVRIYVATTGGFVISGTAEFDAGIYSYNTTSLIPGLASFTAALPGLSTVVLNGCSDFNGQIVANTIVLNALPNLPLSLGSPVTITGEPGASGQGYFQPADYYAYSGGWQELNGVDQ